MLVEQYLTYALELADLCYVLAKGQVVWAGEPGELQASRRRSAAPALPRLTLELAQLPCSRAGAL